MGMMVLLLDEGAEVTSLDAPTATRLVDLGVTNVCLLREGDTVALVLDGWSFDPAHSGRDAAAIFGPTTRALHPLLQTTLMSDRTGRATTGNP